MIKKIKFPAMDHFEKAVFVLMAIYLIMTAVLIFAIKAHTKSINTLERTVATSGDRPTRIQVEQIVPERK